MGRRKSPQPRLTKLTVMLADSEYDALYRAAAAANEKIGEFTRRRAIASIEKHPQPEAPPPYGMPGAGPSPKRE